MVGRRASRLARGVGPLRRRGSGGRVGALGLRHRLAAVARMKLIRVAVIGAGHWGPNLIRNFHNHTTSEVAWVIDRDEARLKLAESRYPGIRISTDPAVAFADPEVDAVVISTPTITHYELASAALA